MENKNKMGKKEKQTEKKSIIREKISVPIYADEFDAVMEKTKVIEVTNRTIREYFGLKPVAKRTGKNSEIRKALGEKLKTMSDEEKEKLLKKLTE